MVATANLITANETALQLMGVNKLLTLSRGRTN